VSAPFGIDLGTTNSVISRLVDGRPVPIAIAGDPIVPSVVLFAGDRVVVGREARNLELEHPEQTIRSVKRKMGQDFTYEINGARRTPEEVSAEILRALKEGAAATTGVPVQDVVITVPAYFDDAQRRATLKAGELAGLNVLRLLNEPTSASLVYEKVDRARATGEPELILIYDLGGGTFDVSVLECFEGVREVRATTGNSALGGDDFDELLVRHFVDSLKGRQGVNPSDDPRAMARLRRVAESTKIALSTATSVEVREEFLTKHQGKPIHLELEVTRRELEAMIAPLVDSTLALVRQAVADAKLGDQRLSHICLVGGSTRIPLVRAHLEAELGVDVRDEVDVDLAVGLGAAIQAGILLGAPVERILVDVASHSLGLKAFGQEDEFRDEVDTFVRLIPRNTALPALRAEEFYTIVDQQERISVEVYQGESSRTSENTRVGAFDYPLKPCPAHTPVKVQFEYDLNGVVKVSVTQRGAEEKTVALSVADASAAPSSATLGPAARLGSAVERKGRRLLESLGGAEKARLEALLTRLEGASDAQREAFEDELLDFFLDVEAD
jgi:molecular chaperone DnaK